MYLVYTVNDPRGGTIGTEQVAHVLIAQVRTENGAEPQRDVLITFPGFIFHTVPSPDGKYVAFVGSAHGEGGVEERHLFIFDMRTGLSRDVSSTGFYSRAVQTPPIFTPEGSTILFISRWTVDSGEFNIFKCDASTGAISGLYTNPVEDVPLGLMPDGNHCIAVTRNSGAPGSYNYISIDVADGTYEVLHTFSNVTKVGPPHADYDGARIFCDIKPSEENMGSFMGTPSREAIAINLEDNTETCLLDPNTVNYVYQLFQDSEDETRLLLRRQEGVEGEDTPFSRIATCRVDGSRFTYLTDTSARAYLLRPPTNIHPISPDNSLIFYYRQDPVFEHEDIWVMNPDGTGSLNISNTAGYNEGSAGWIVIPGNIED
jgi:Tol biopolymer transport system component